MHALKIRYFAPEDYLGLKKIFKDVQNNSHIVFKKKK